MDRCREFYAIYFTSDPTMKVHSTEKSLSDRSLCINKLGDKQNDFLDMSVTLEKRKEI